MTRTIAVVVPTRSEAGNVRELHRRLHLAMEAAPGTRGRWHAVFVDDSDDETTDILRALAAEHATAALLHRPAGERSGGLGGAVLAGVDTLGIDVEAIVVMDADLQHPPEAVPGLVAAVLEPGYDVAVGSRYVGGGAADGLDGAYRRLASVACREAARRVLRSARSVGDPLSGFFALRPEVLAVADLQPDGYKILLEILVRGRWKGVREVPFAFEERNAGDSKSGAREAARFARHLWTLRQAAARLTRRPERTAPATPGPLRVLILTSEAPPVVSGISRTVATLRDGLSRQGHHVDVVSRADFPRFMRREVRVSAFPFYWPRFRKLLSQYDVVNVHGPVPTISEVFLALVRTLPKARRPGVVYTHHSDLAIPGLDRSCAWYNRLSRQLAHTADDIVVTSDAYQDRLVRDAGAPVHVIPWALDVVGRVVARKPTVHPGRLRALFVGQLRPYKGLDQLLSAVAGQPELDLAVVGDGPMREELAARVEREGLDNVHLVGRVSDEELWDAYSDADVIVLPSTTTAEAFGLVLLEGMAAGCVPVASDLPGVRSVAENAGVVVEPGQVEPLRESLLDLAHDPVRLSELSDLSTYVAGEQGLHRMISSYEDVLRGAAESSTVRQSAAATPDGFDGPQEFLAAVADDLHTGNVSVSLIDPQGGDFARVWQHEEDGAPLVHSPIAAHAARTGEPVVVHGATPGAPWGEDAEEGADARPGTTMHVPLPAKRGGVAVVSVEAEPGAELDQAAVVESLQRAGVESRPGQPAVAAVSPS